MAIIGWIRVVLSKPHEFYARANRYKDGLAAYYYGFMVLLWGAFAAALSVWRGWNSLVMFGQAYHALVNPGSITTFTGELGALTWFGIIGYTQLFGKIRYGSIWFGRARQEARHLCQLLVRAVGGKTFSVLSPNPSHSVSYCKATLCFCLK